MVKLSTRTRVILMSSFWLTRTRASPVVRTGDAETSELARQVKRQLPRAIMAVRNRAAPIRRLHSIEEVAIRFLLAYGTPPNETGDSEAYDTPLSGPKIQQAMLHSHSL